MASRPLKENESASCLPTWQFSALFEGASTERDPLTLCTYVALFQFKVICHERVYKRDERCNCMEYTWSIKRRFSDFQQLDAGLRSTLPDCPSLPKTSLWRQICPSEEFVKQRATELFQYLSTALKLAQQAAEASSEFLDAADICANLPIFLGMQEASDSRAWAPPLAEERQVALVHSFDRGTFVFGHLEAGTQLTKHDRQATIGTLTCTHAEVRPAKTQQRVKDGGAKKSAATTPPTDPGSFCSSVWSEGSSPLPSPAESRAASPLRRWMASDDSSASTVDTKGRAVFELQVEELPVKKPPSPCVWMEVDLDTETSRFMEHRQWWAWARSQRNEEEESVPMPTQVRFNTDVERRRLRERYECVAALWRELSVDNEVLHTILGYGVEGRTLVVTHQMAPTFTGLRDVTFRKDSCNLVLTQALKALAYLHGQNLAHGHLCPESFLVDEGKLEKRVRLVWMPGQRRIEGSRRAPATLGFKGPGEDGPAGDLWSFACVLLVWYFNFSPAPHPWFQFAKCQQLRQAIHAALGQKEPELPQALLDLHSSAAAADENDAHVLLVAQVCTRCLQWVPEERSSAKELQIEVADHL